MRCIDCFHYNACGNASMYSDPDSCKLALPRSEINELRVALEKAQREISKLRLELDYATDCINEVDDALYRGGKNDWAQAAIDNYRRRYDDSL